MGQFTRLGKRELICLLLFSCNYVVSVWIGFLFLWVLGNGYIILLWHSLSLPYNYLVILRLVLGLDWVLIVSVPDLCILFTFINNVSQRLLISDVLISTLI